MYKKKKSQLRYLGKYTDRKVYKKKESKLKYLAKYSRYVYGKRERKKKINYQGKKDVWSFIKKLHS